MSQSSLFNKSSNFSKEYDDLIHELTNQINMAQPDDVLQYCFDFFLSRLLNERTKTRQEKERHLSVHPSDTTVLQGSLVSTNDVQTPHNEEDEDEEEEEGKNSFRDLPQFKTHMQNRRVSVSAESIQPDKLARLEKNIPKSTAEQDMIYQSLSSHFLFKTIEEEQREEIIQIMEQKTFPAGTHVIEQGGEGDYFYIVSSGHLDCFVDGQKVTSYERGGSFGELALMYNAPRAATIVATTNAVLWALDRISFRSIIMKSNAAKRTMHESFLKGVPLFKSLEISEIHKIADSLVSVRYKHGDVVVKEGEPGNNFYLIEDGKAVVYKTAPDGTQQKVNEMKKGDYFGGMPVDMKI
ncbi:camp-dependent protein kinase regulatory subunit [Rhizopus microsporus var. microsporus]|uniref:cAMP-dependent protein kinase regulatory subunit n=1 Tax=Rhizopus microsporus var. microsporus TaxID=86635 RepID=A0A1X0QW30_RHIZD|nr:camp-dependent protein kinase regulatory subunit [Rhizopus microsporus var. microsporus]